MSLAKHNITIRKMIVQTLSNHFHKTHFISLSLEICIRMRLLMFFNQNHQLILKKHLLTLKHFHTSPMITVKDRRSLSLENPFENLLKIAP